MSNNNKNANLTSLEGNKPNDDWDEKDVDLYYKLRAKKLTENKEYLSVES